MSAPHVAAIVGSGTLPYTRAILPESQRGNEPLGEGVRTGLQVMIGNPEDLLAPDAFATSGITVGTTPIKIVSPYSNPLPRCTSLTLVNFGNADIYISHTPDNIVADGYILSGSLALLRAVTFKSLHNVDIWATSAAGSNNLRMLMY